jgi:hypothetical protein
MIRLFRSNAAAATLLAVACSAISATAARAQTSRFGDLADGPYDRLVIQNAMVIPGHGGPPVGPYDIVIEQNMITEMTTFDPVTAERRGDTARATGDRVIDAEGICT